MNKFLDDDDESGEWLANDWARRGHRAKDVYWDFRDKSMTPPEVMRALLATRNITNATDEELNDIEEFIVLRDYSYVGFFTQDQKLALKIIKGGADFLFDKASGIWMLDMFGCHQIIMRSLQAFHTNVDQFTLEYRDAADAYIEECRGFFESGAASYGPPTVRMGENYELPSELKSAFARMKYEIWRL